MNEIFSRLDILSPKQSDTIVLFYNTTDFDVEAVCEVYKEVQDSFPTNTVLALPDLMSLAEFDKEELLGLLEPIVQNLRKEAYDNEMH